MLKLIPIKVH